MGLLDDLISQVSGAATGRSATAPSPRAQGASASGVGMGSIMMTLMPVVLAMLSRGQGGPSSGIGRASAGGGLGDILGQMLGGSTGGAGGLGGLLEQFQRAGFGEQARSWVSTGENQPIPPDAVGQVFGSGGLAEIARRTGLTESDACRGLSQLFPEVVDRLTPNGTVPDESALLASVESLAKRFNV